jgi:uncharacterized RDD family membrane protein YckC
MDVLDQPLVQADTATVKYGGFWSRFGALILDGFILAPFSLGLSYFNITSWKSSLALVVITLIGLAYKPFMEFNYGATLGKMAFKLKVVNNDLERASLGEILLRNIFNIVPSLITLFVTLGVYADPEFGDITGFMEYTAFTQQYAALQFISYGSGILSIIDGIVLIADDQKRSLHDKIAKTFVVDQS